MIASWRDGAGSFTRIRSNYFRSVWRRGWKGDAWMNKPASAKCITRFLTPDQTFSFSRIIFISFPWKRIPLPIFIYKFFPNFSQRLKRLFERKRVNIISRDAKLEVNSWWNNDISETSSCVILQGNSLNLKILILTKVWIIYFIFTKEIIILRTRPTLEVSFLSLSLEICKIWASSRSKKCYFVKMYTECIEVYFSFTTSNEQIFFDYRATYRTTSSDCHLKGCYTWKLGNFHCKWISTNRVAGANLQPVKGGIRYRKHEKL